MKTMPVPFIVLSTVRSGSTHLIRLLNDHPAVVCNGEVMNPDDPDYNWDGPPPKTTDEMIKAAFENYPLRGHDAARVQAVGCKLDDGSILNCQGRLPQLMKIPGMRFVVMQRRNQFECARSFLQAFQTTEWQLQKGQKSAPVAPVTMSPITARSFFERAEVFYGRIALVVPPTQRFWIDYEAFRGHTAAFLDHLWTILEVPPHTSTPSLTKMEERPLSETVANYEELQMLYEHTDYSIFLP